MDFIPEWFFTWDNFRNIMGSDFSKSAIGSLFGAWGGAYAIQRIAERDRVRKALIQEIRNTNSAIQYTYNAFNAYTNFKEQISRPLKNEYDAQYTAVHAHAAALADGMRDLPALELRMNLHTIDEVRLPVEKLEEAVGEKLSTGGRPIPLTLIITQTTHQLNRCIRGRNELITAVRAMEGGDFEKMRFMFGLRRGGVIDETFKNMVHGIYDADHQCIYFTWRLCKDLREHGLRYRKEYKRRFRGDVPHVMKVLFDGPQRKGLLPEASEFPDWEHGFVGRIPVTLGRWPGRARCAHRAGVRSVRRRWLHSGRPAAAYLLGTIWVLLKGSIATALVSAVVLIAGSNLGKLIVMPLWRRWFE